MNEYTIVIAYLCFLFLMNIVTFILYYADKQKAKKNKWRIRESTLLSFSLIGGAVGAILAMKLFHHKTKHWYFHVCAIAGLLIQIGVGFFLNQIEI